MPVCYADPNPIFKPAMRLIASITQSYPVIVTTTFAHSYISGTIVRLDVPVADGMQQINQQQGAILVTGDTTFTMDINSTYYDPFAIPLSPSPHDEICAQVVPIGEINSILAAAVKNVLNATM
jgi:hypothetical protein